MRVRSVIPVICLGVVPEFHLGLPTTYCTVSCSALLHARINILLICLPCSHSSHHSPLSYGKYQLGLIIPLTVAV